MSDRIAEARRAVEATLDTLIAGVGVEATYTVSEGDEGADLHASLEGEGLEALVGREGETVDAVQYLLTQIASRAGGGERVRVGFDVAGYRGRRAKALRDLASQAGAEAVEFGDEIELDPMSPHDRRIVHMELKDNAAVTTRSEGDEPRRRIIVEPADA